MLERFGVGYIKEANLDQICRYADVISFHVPLNEETKFMGNEQFFAALQQNPVILLDDIFDKLDKVRVKKLLELVSNNQFGQVLVTDTDEDRLRTIFSMDSMEIKMFNVEQGTVVES